MYGNLQPGALKRSTLDNLRDEKANIEQRLVTVDTLIAMFEKSPDLIKVVDLLNTL